MSKPIVIVAGLGRCGTSLVMQMLAAGGVPCIGRFPAFEEHDPRVLGGRAVKWLDPHRNPLRVPLDARYKCIWLGRDPHEQAASQRKFLRLVAGVESHATDEAWVRSLRDETGDALRRVPMPRLITTFEAVIERPRATAVMIADFLGRHFRPLDIDAMAACVIKRGPECQPGMDIEANLSRVAEGVFA